jgi:hypothetical protein
MMAHRSHADASRRNFGRDEAETVSSDDLKVGCLQRIATATEKMAEDRDRLVRDRDYLRGRVDELSKDNERMARRIRALRGVITRLKRDDGEAGPC